MRVSGRGERRRPREARTKKGAAAKARLALLEGKGKNAAATSAAPLFGVRKVRIGHDKRHPKHYRTDNAAYGTSTSWWNFLPRVVYHHTYDVPIAWHLLISLCNYTLPSDEQFTAWYCLAPVCFVLAYRVLWDLCIAIKSAQRDGVQNKRTTLHLDPKTAGFKKLKWEQIRVGDIVCLKDGEESPADMVFISCSNPEGVAYADTSGWLGTSELLLKYAVKETKNDSTVSSLLTLAGSVVCPHPLDYVCMNRAALESFTGSLKLRTYPRPTPLTGANLILRGTRIVDVDFIFGIVIYCGRDSYVNRVHKSRPHKRGFLSELFNRLSLITLFLIFLALLIDMISHGIWLSRNGWFQNLDRQLTSAGTGVSVMTSLLRHLHLVPLVVIPTLDLQRFFQAQRIAQDPRLGKMTASGDFEPALVNSVDIVEHLGTVDVAVFDKTGTITTGDLHFTACSIGLRDYGKVEGVTVENAVLTEASDANTIHETDSVITPTAIDHSATSGEFSGTEPSTKKSLLETSPLHGQAKRRSASLIPGPNAPMPTRQVREAWQKLRQLREQSDDSSLHELPSCSERDATSDTDEDEPPYRDLVQVRLVRHSGERSVKLPPIRPFSVTGIAASTSAKAPPPPPPAPKRAARPSQPPPPTSAHTSLAAVRQQASLPPPCPGLLDQTYLPRPLSYPRHFRDDLNYVVNRNSLVFTDRSIFDAFHAGGRQSLLTVHFCRALALCNSVRPVFVCNKLPQPLHARSSDTVAARRSTRAGTITDVRARPSRPGPGEWCRRRPTRDAQAEFDSSMGAPYLSLLNWQITEEPDEQQPTDDEHRTTHHCREELWNPRYIGYLRLRAKRKEDICCAATAARLGFALVSRTGDYADLDINGQFRRFELLGTTNPDSSVTSIVCRQEDEFEATLYAQGTESGVVGICDLSPAQRKTLKRRLRQFSRAGYRPIIFAYRTLSRNETRTFRKAYEDIRASLYKATDRFNKVCRKLHTRLKIMAVVFLRDELTNGTEECFSLLKQAGCATWILTGDRLAPTVQAATCAKMINPKTRLFSVTEIWRRIRARRRMNAKTAAMNQSSQESVMGSSETVHEDPKGSALIEGGHELKRELFELFAEFRRVRCKTPSSSGLCCVFSSPVVAAFLSRTELQTVFILMSCEADAVIGYNLTPPQKAAIVTVIQLCLSPSPVVMAVGDSFGDCDMLCDATIGIALFPCRTSDGSNFAETAVRFTADINVASLSALRVLLVCHGIDILERNCRTVLFCVYKSGVVGWAVFFYGFVATTSSHRPYKADFMVPVILLAWTLFIPLLTLIYPQLAFPPNRNIAAAHYASSRARTYLKSSTSLVAVIDGFVSSLIMMVCLVCIGNYNDMAPDGTVRPVLQDCLAIVAVGLIFARFMQIELSTPVAPTSYVFVACLLAAIPVLIGYGVYFWAHIDALQFFEVPQLFFAGLCALLINLVICRFLLYVTSVAERNIGTVARLSQFSRMESGGFHESITSFGALDHLAGMSDIPEIRQAQTQLFTSPDAVPSDSSTDGELTLEQMQSVVEQAEEDSEVTRVIGISEVVRESVIFRLVSRLIPYTMVLYVNTKDILVGGVGSTLNEESNLSTVTDEDSRRMNSRALSLVGSGGGPPADNVLMRDVREAARASFASAHRIGQQGADEEAKDAGLIDDVVSVTSWNLGDAEGQWSDDLLKSQSELESSSSDSTGSSAGLETNSSSDAGSMSQSMESLGSARGSESTTRRSLNLAARDRGNEEIGTGRAPTADEDINSLLDKSKVRFRDQQLEEEFLELNSGEREQFANCYRLFFVGCVLQSLAEVHVQTSTKVYEPFMLAMPILRLIIPLIFLATSYSHWAWKHFDTLATFEAIILIATYIPSRLTQPPCHANGQFAIWTLVISRTPMSVGITLNLIWIIVAVVGDVFLYPPAAVVYAASFNLGVIAFAAFAGQRVHITQRRRFLLNHQAEISRRNQKEILNTMLPDFVVDKMLTHPINEDGIPEGLRAEEPGIVTVIFCDVYEFQTLVSILPATRLVELLDNLFLYFDKCAEQFGVCKIETVFETYLSCAGIRPGSGLQTENPARDAFDALDMSLAMLEVTSYTRYEIDDATDGESSSSSSGKTRTERLRVKVGMHSGTVTSGVVGAKKPQYALFGDTVNTASRMKLTGEADHVHISDFTYGLLCNDSSLSWQARQLEVKGKGLMTTYLLTAVTGSLYPHYATAEVDEVDLREDRKPRNQDPSQEANHEAVLPSHEAVLPSSFSPSVSSYESQSLPRSHPSSADIKLLMRPWLTESERRQLVKPKIQILANLSTCSQQSSTLPKEEPERPLGSVRPPGTVRRLFNDLRQRLANRFLKFKSIQQLITSSSLTKSVEFDLMSAFPTASMQSSALHGSEPPAHRDLFVRSDRRRGSRQSSLDPAAQSINGDADLSQTLETRSTNLGTTATAVDDLDIISTQASSFGMMKFTQSMNFLSLTFKSLDMERSYASFAKRDPPYLRAIQSSIIIFLLVTAVTSVSRVYAEWTETLDGVIDTLFAPLKNASSMPLFIEIAVEDDAVLGYWWIRAFEMLFGFLVWLLFHTAMSRNTSTIKTGWAVDSAGFLYFLSMTVFLVTPTWRSVAERRSDDLTWHWHSDTTELGFCFMALHHNSGLLFHNLILLDVLVLTLVLVFLSIVLTPSMDTKFTTTLAPMMFIFQIISAYVKEAFTRYTWFATQDFLSTEDRARELLSDMLPKQVLEDFKADNLKLAYHHEKITFLFADIVGFTSYAKSVEAKDVVRLLQKLFARFDRDSTRFQLYKLCTIGDAYVAVSEPGVEGDENFDPIPGADKVWSMARSMLRNIREVANEVNVPSLNMRIGLHFGQCVGGVIGSGRLRYDFWGMDVLTGNSMESAGCPGHINCSETLKNFMETSFPNRFDFEFNKTVNVLHLAVNSYFVHERASIPEAVPEVEIARSRAAGQRRGGKRRLSMLSARPTEAAPPARGTDGRAVSLSRNDLADLETLRKMYGDLRLDDD